MQSLLAEVATAESKRDRFEGLYERECARAQERADQTEEIKKLDDSVDILSDALEFYGDPASYSAISFLLDPPCGLFAYDVSEDHDDPDFPGPRPGKLAREALDKVGDLLEKG